mgnify:CR=1 FL=1
MDFFKIIAIGILTCIVAIVVKQIKPEFYIVIVISGGIIMFLMLVEQLKTVIDYFLTIFTKVNLDYSLFVLIIKILGVGYLTEFAQGICIDTGNASIGEKILIGGKIIILCLALPIITSLLDMILALL